MTTPIYRDPTPTERRAMAAFGLFLIIVAVLAWGAAL